MQAITGSTNIRVSFLLACFKLACAWDEERRLYDSGAVEKWNSSGWKEKENKLKLNPYKTEVFFLGPYSDLRSGCTRMLDGGCIPPEGSDPQLGGTSEPNATARYAGTDSRQECFYHTAANLLGAVGSHLCYTCFCDTD